MGFGVLDENGCGSCELSSTCNTPYMPYSGKGKKKILVIAEAPGRREDEDGTQLIGQAGQFLRRNLKTVGIDLDVDCWKTNSICCRPPKNRTPTDKEIACCRPRLFREIKELAPKVIIVLGLTAIKAVIGSRWKKDLGALGKWRGFAIPDRQYNAWIVPTYHPAYFLRPGQTVIEQKVFAQDLKYAVSMLPEKIDCLDYEDKLTLLSGEEANDYISSILKDKPEYAAFDYETTGLKPYFPEHEVVCCSICCDPDESVAFMMDEIDKSLFCKFLASPIKKIASNIKFESVWSKVTLNQEVKNWGWDTMLAAHVTDNRSGITSIKFQSLLYLGVWDYSSDIDKYLKAKDENSFNRVKELSKTDPKKLLSYCATDSLVEYHVAMKQMEQFGD